MKGELEGKRLEIYMAMAKEGSRFTLLWVLRMRFNSIPVTNDYIDSKRFVNNNKSIPVYNSMYALVGK